MMRVAVRDTYGRLHVLLEVGAGASLADVKRTLATRLGLPADVAAAPGAVRLIFAGKLLADGALLDDILREVRAPPQPLVRTARARARMQSARESASATVAAAAAAAAAGACRPGAANQRL